jgi:synaptic vesicle membrane protein VAT-1
VRQVWIPKAGAPGVLELVEAPDPAPAAGEVRVRVAAAGVGFTDVLARMGLLFGMPKMPLVTGFEVAGTVDAVGEGVPASWRGREVIGVTHFGGYADVVTLPLGRVFAKPAALTMQEAAALPIAFLTAYQALVVMGSLRAGETVLLHSIGGGVGLAAMQIAKNAGARVIGTASAHKHEQLRELGADELIDPRVSDLEERVRALTDGNGVQLVLDSVGGGSVQRSYRCLSTTGRLATIGMSSVATSKSAGKLSLLRMITSLPWLKLNVVSFINDNKGVFGIDLMHIYREPKRLATWMGAILEQVEAGKLRSRVDRSFPLERAADAHHYLQERKNLGKVVLDARAGG